MTSKSRDTSQLDAVNKIYAALEPLDPDARQRVVSSALSLLGIQSLPSSLESRRLPDSPRDEHRSEAITRKKSPVELIQEKNPATNTQRIALFAYYREKFEGEPRFSRADLRPYFGKAKEPPPANYDRDFSKAVSAGWIHEDAAESYLTSKGLEAVEAGFGGKARPRGRSAGRKAPSRTKKLKGNGS